MIHVSFEPNLQGQTNMARDRMLLVQGGARVYTWSEPWVTLGAFQRSSSALRTDCPIPWSRRPTGGRAVLHGHDVTVGLCLPLPAPHGVRRVYPVIVGLLVSALRGCDVDAVIGRELVGDDPPKSRSSDCFHALSPNDVADSRGRKICGCALRLTDRAVLVQASIPANVPLVDPKLVYDDPAPIYPLALDAGAFAESLQEAMIGWEDAASWATAS